MMGRPASPSSGGSGGDGHQTVDLVPADPLPFLGHYLWTQVATGEAA